MKTYEIDIHGFAEYLRTQKLSERTIKSNEKMGEHDE